MEISYASDTEVVRSEKDQRQQKNVVGYVCSILPTHVMYILSKDTMSYKTYYSKWEIILARIRVIQHRIHDAMNIWDIAYRFSMHRNTVGNIMNIYEAHAPPEFREKIISGSHFSLEEIESCIFLLPDSRRPKSHSKQASKTEEEKIMRDFEKVKVWAKKLVMMLKRKKELGNLTLAKVRWIYKRNGFRVQKVRTKNWEVKSLYNYQALWAFEHIHYDTKELADSHSLPEDVYENLKHNKQLPLYEWNLIDVASRTRFIAYSRWKSSTFWIQFLVLVLSHLRYHGITRHIQVHTDWGSEFFSWSERKGKEWNSILRELDGKIDCYNPNWDIHKNLIERSHKSDDEEFLIPFGAVMKTKKKFMAQAQEYSDYWNFLRAHSGKAMDGKTPEEKLQSLWIYQAKQILTFKVRYLDESFDFLQKHLEYFLFQRLLRSIPKEKFISDRKTHIDLITKYSHMWDYAQNVLTYYLFRGLFLSWILIRNRLFFSW